MKINTRLLIILGSLLIIFEIIIIVLVNYSMRSNALAEAEKTAKIILDRNLATHTFFSKQLKPNVFRLTDPLVSKDYFDPSWMSSTYAVREIDKYFKSLDESEYYYKECAINARSPENEADEYEADFLKKVNRDPDFSYQSSVRTIDGKPYFTVLRRGEVLEEGCLRCHSTPENAPAGLVEIYGSERSFHRNIGEVISAISIRVPISIPYEHAKHLTIQLIAFFLIALLSLFGAQLWFNKQYILSPINVIRSKAFQITEDETQLGEEIQMSKCNDLNKLITSFNAMSTKLGRSRDQLLDLVKERTLELSDANENLKKEAQVRKQAEKKIITSLKEKETLLHEIHHRVKNNMAVISGLLRLQLNSTDNKIAKEALQDSQNRVQSMSKIHETLYRSDNLSSIDLKTYLSELGGTIFQNYSISNKVQFRVEAENIVISVKQASPVGLIVNELITNCLKYAFADDREGEILLELKSIKENEIELIISDNGVGMPEGFDLEKADSLGLKLIKLLVENQLDGSIDMDSNNGTKFNIKFNIET
jgi:two-component sensor histidine kinase